METPWTVMTKNKAGRSVAPASSNLGDTGMVMRARACPLRLESSDDLLGVHAQLYDLRADLAADRLLLLSHVRPPSHPRPIFSSSL